MICASLCFYMLLTNWEETSELMWPLFGPAGFCGLGGGQFGRPSVTIRHDTAGIQGTVTMDNTEDYNSACTSG